jgi:glycosyltransferase involved in cell wall biosynthesis
MSKAGVYIPVFNGAAFISTAIRSVLDQSYPDVKAVIVDNASTDETVRIVKDMQGKYGSSRLQLVQNEKNIGLFGNLNKCLSLVDIDYFAILCADDYYCSQRAIEDCVEVMEQDPAVAAVFGDIRIVDSHGMDLTAVRFGRSGKFETLALMRESIMKGRNRFGISALMRRTEHEPTYSEDLAYSADVEFAFQHAGSRSVYYMSDGPLIANRYHLNNASRALHWRARAELWRVGRRNGVFLNATERVSSFASAVVSSCSKTVFFQWVAFRRSFSWKAHSGSMDIAPWVET